MMLEFTLAALPQPTAVSLRLTGNPNKSIRGYAS
jgi:hypothetical protein